MTMRESLANLDVCRKPRPLMDPLPLRRGYLARDDPLLDFAPEIELSVSQTLRGKDIEYDRIDAVNRGKPKIGTCQILSQSEATSMWDQVCREINE